MKNFLSFAKEFYAVTTPFYLKTVVVLMATVFPVQTAVAHYRRRILRPHEAVVAIIGTIAVIQFYFLLKSYSVRVPAFPFERLEYPLWHAYVFPLIDLLKRSSLTFRVLDFFYLFVWGVSCGVSVIALFTERREAKHFLLSLAVCYLVTGTIYLLIRGISPYYVFEERFRFLAGLAPLSHSLHEASRRATEYLATTDLAGVVAGVGYPFQPISAFPSFHVSYAYLVSAFVRDYSPERLKGLCWSFVLAMAVSAVLLGFHWLADVVAGVLIGRVSLAVSAPISGIIPGRRSFAFSRAQTLFRSKPSARRHRRSVL